MNDQRSADPQHLCVVLHDVAPANWSDCTRVLGMLRAAAHDAGVELPVTLLVVPRLHGAAELPRPYLRWLQQQAQHGHELALHGLTHLDEGPPATSLAEHLLRRRYTAGEGEFAALDAREAAERLALGRAWARTHGLQISGFVAPAWLLSAESWQAVAAAGFDYTCTLGQVVSLPERRALNAPSLVFSTRSAWRRAVSPLWNRWMAWHAKPARLLRLELHPADGEHAAIVRCWSALLARALRSRQPLRLREAALLARRFGARPAGKQA
jgi:predicted deacetylase